MASRHSLTALRIGTALIALTAAVPAFAQNNEGAVAQDTENTPGAGDEMVSNDEVTETTGEIVVTARRREENLRDVPIAITAYTGEALEAQGALDITDLADTTPNVTLETSRGTNTTLTAFIRGVGQQDPVAGFEAGVGIYLDDVYLNRPQAAVLDIYDVERIEILRGPQGTLYGRNTIGGAVKYVTRRLPEEPSLRVRATLGTYKQADLVVSGSAPITDEFRIGASIARLSRDGFGKNLTTGKDNYNRDIWAGRFSAEGDLPGAFLRFSADYTKDKSDPRGGHRLIPSLITNAPVLDDEFDSRGALLDPKQEVESGGVSFRAELELTDDITFRSITAYRADRSGTPIDFDALPSADLDVPAIYKNNQTSQELQLLYSSGGLSALIGAYYLNAYALTEFDVRIFTTVPGLAASTRSEIETDTTALFADFTYDFTEQLSVSLGARYTWDKRKGDIFRQNFLGGGSPTFGGAGIPFLGAPPATDFEGSRSYRKFTPRASVSFKPTEDHNIYLSYSQGFKGGGFDPRGVGTNAPDLNGNGIREQEEVAAFIGFAPETVDSYEIGYKASLLDRRLNLAIAAFRADYSDVQVPGSVPCVSGGVATFCGVTANAGKARFQGIEVEANAVLARDFAAGGDRLNLAGTLGYIDAEYREYISNIANKPTDVSDFREVQNTPKWTASGTLAYTTPMAGGELGFNSTVSYRSKTYQFEIPNPFLDQKGFALWDASLVWRSEGDRWSVGLHGKNLTDKRYKTSGYTFLAANPLTGELLKAANGNFISGTGREGTLTSFYGNPRQVYLTVGLNF